MNIDNILNTVNEYIAYSSKRGCRDWQHWDGIYNFIDEHEDEITAIEWQDCAGGFMSFIIEAGSTFVMSNELFDDVNNTFEYDLSLKSFKVLEEEEFDFDLLPHQVHRYWGDFHLMEGGN